MMTRDEELRKEALYFAIQANPLGSMTTVLDAAQRCYDFLRNTGHTAPTKEK